MPFNVLLSSESVGPIVEGDPDDNSTPQSIYQLSFRLFDFEAEDLLHDGDVMAVELVLDHGGTDASDFQSITVNAAAGVQTFSPTGPIAFEITGKDVNVSIDDGKKVYSVAVAAVVNISKDDDEEAATEAFSLSLAKLDGVDATKLDQKVTLQLQDDDRPTLTEGDMEWSVPSADHGGPRHWSVYRVGGSVHQEGDPDAPNAVDFNVTAGISKAQFDALCNCDPFKVKLDLRHIDTDAADFAGITVKTASGTQQFSSEDIITADITIEDIYRSNPDTDKKPLWSLSFEVTVHFNGDDEVDGKKYEDFSLDITEIGGFAVTGGNGQSKVSIWDDDEPDEVSMHDEPMNDVFGPLLDPQPEPVSFPKDQDDNADGGFFLMDGGDLGSGIQLDPLLEIAEEEPLIDVDPQDILLGGGSDGGLSTGSKAPGTTNELGTGEQNEFPLIDPIPVTDVLAQPIPRGVEDDPFFGQTRGDDLISDPLGKGPVEDTDEDTLPILDLPPEANFVLDDVVLDAIVFDTSENVGFVVEDDLIFASSGGTSDTGVLADLLGDVQPVPELLTITEPQTQFILGDL